MQVLKSTNGENIPYLEIIEVVLLLIIPLLLMLLIIIINKIQQSYIHSFIHYIHTFVSEYSYIAVWFTHQNPKRLEIEDKINIMLVIN